MKRVITFFTRLSEAYLPDAFVFGLVLTLVVFVISWATTPHSSIALIGFWGKDFWTLNAFAMQMIFVLITGHMLASTPPVMRALDFLSGLVKTQRSALVLLSLISTFACWINWGFGLIVSGVLATLFAGKLKQVNFGLFVATAYAGFLVWHGGLSGSIPLKLAGQDEILNQIYPGLSIPLSQTIFSTRNILLVLLLMITMPLLGLSMMTDDKVEVSLPVKKDLKPDSTKSFRDSLENTRILNVLIFIFFIIVIFDGAVLDINRVNFIFLGLAILFHGTPVRFLLALKDSFALASGIAIQFPFYAGLMGLMQNSGLADQISLIFVSISNQETLALWTFLSGGIVNFFVPSGGGQWVVQGPIMLKAAKELGVDPGKISMALAWGDAWTNLIQPFWILPLLALAGIKLKEVMGYCLLYLVFSGFIICSVFYLI